jgi:hypothetical protein
MYGPTTAFGIVATGLVATGLVATGPVVIVILVYAVTNLACIGYYAKHRPEERTFWLRILIPILGFLFLVPGFRNAAGITGIPGLNFIASLPKPLSYRAWAVRVSMIFGFAWLFKLRASATTSIGSIIGGSTRLSRTRRLSSSNLTTMTTVIQKVWPC